MFITSTAHKAALSLLFTPLEQPHDASPCLPGVLPEPPPSAALGQRGHGARAGMGCERSASQKLLFLRGHLRVSSAFPPLSPLLLQSLFSGFTKESHTSTLPRSHRQTLSHHESPQETKQRNNCKMNFSWESFKKAKSKLAAVRNPKKT